jgi:prepilin-type N-terminal cleavage/methylation domain-containing protein
MRRVSGFTLVELLVVIAIMVIIMGFSVPMFSKMSFGNAVDGASRMISSQLSLARAEAVAKRQYIAIVMPGNDFNQPDDGKTTDEYNFRSFRAAIVEDDDDNDDNTFNFKAWFPGTEWSFLPKGAVIAEADGDAEAKTVAEGIECKIDYDTEGEVKTREQYDNWLGSDSKLGQDSNPTLISDTDDAKMVDGKDNKKKNDGTFSGVRAVVFKPNGRVAGGTKYVTLIEGIPTEATSASSGDYYRLTNGNIKNMRLMRVGRLTGKVTYVETEYEAE